MNGDTLACRSCGHEISASQVSDMDYVDDEDDPLYGHVLCPECDGRKWGFPEEVAAA